MIDTTDLTSYCPGYDNYCEPKEFVEKYDYSDELHEEFMIRKELEKMERKIIDLETTTLTFDEIFKLENYVWKGNKLIPEEMIGCE